MTLPKPTFIKKYFAGEFKVLMAMYSFDRHVPEFRTREWEQIETIDGTQYETGRSVLLPFNR